MIMPHHPLVSIIMPTYNRAYTIQNAIDSIVSQTYNNWGLIIVDDGSTDNTKQLIQQLNHPQISYYFQQNKGPAAARNYGLTKAKGTWIAYLDSDNELFSNYLETMLDWLGKNPKAVFAIPRAHRTRELYENGKLVKVIDHSEDTPESLTLKDIYMMKLSVDTNGFIHLRRIFEEGITWDEKMPAMEDWDLAMTIGEKYPEGFLYVPVVLYNYHQRYGGDGLVSNHTYKDWAIIIEAMYNKHKNDALLAGQDWYPRKVEKWNRLQTEFEAGKIPPYYLHYFQDN
jgi:glycosyltransferase involved in cell wall biosynthesis